MTPECSSIRGRSSWSCPASYSGLVLRGVVGCASFSMKPRRELFWLRSAPASMLVLFLASPHLDNCKLHRPCLSPLGNLSLRGSQVWNKSLQSLGVVKFFLLRSCEASFVGLVGWDSSGGLLIHKGLIQPSPLVLMNCRL